MRFFAAAVVSALVAQARAQPVEETPPIDEAMQGALDDANAHRAWLAPTALTAPAGTWTIVSYEVAVAGLIFSVTDRLEVGAMTFLPISDELPTLAWGHVKLRVLDSGSVHGALRLDGVYVHEVTDASEDDEITHTIASAMAAVTLCVDVRCRSHLGAALGVAFTGTGDELPIGGAASAVVAMTDVVKLVFELDAGYIVNDPHDSPYGAFAWAGVRFTSRAAGVDLGVMRPLCDDCIEKRLKYGFPFVMATIRSVPD
jgi:hypothetical protein